MPIIQTGGAPHSRQVTVTTTPTLLTRVGGTAGRSGILIQQCADSTVDVYLGGATVSASTAGTRGYLLMGTPATSPPTPPAEFFEAVTNQDLYGVTASGTATVIVLEYY